MPTNLTEVSQFTANVPVPDDGEDADASSVVQFAQVFADRSQYLKNAIPELACLSRRSLYAPGDGSVRFDGLRVVLSGKLYSLAAGNLGVTGLASNTWYYVYVYVSGGALVTEYVTTAPDDSLCFKTGDATRRYVGPFRTDGSGVPLPMRYSDGHCTYRISATASPAHAYYNLTGPASFADLSLAAWVPPTARIARLFAQLTLATSTAQLQLRTKGDTLNAWQSRTLTGPDADEWNVEIETGSTQLIQHNADGQTETVFVTGFRE